MNIDNLTSTPVNGVHDYLSFFEISPSDTYIAILGADNADSFFEYKNYSCDIQIVDIETGQVDTFPTNANCRSKILWAEAQAKIYYQSNNDDIYSLDLISGHILNLTNSSSFEVLGDISQDGTKLLFYSQKTREEAYNIYMLNLISHETLQVTYADHHQTSPYWLDDQLHIIYKSIANDTTSISVLNIETNQSYQLLEEIDFIYQIWDVLLR